MPDLHPCPACAELVVAGTCVCPHCGGKACKRSGVHGPAVLLGLTLAAVGTMGCPGQPKYGVPSTGSTPGTDTAETSVQRHAPDFAEAIVDRRVELLDAVEHARQRAREEAE